MVENDPLEILVVPHAVIEWQTKIGTLKKKYFPKKAKQEKEAGKYAIFHGKTRLNNLFDTHNEATAEIERIVGDKRKCLENKRIFQVKLLV